MIDRQLGMLLRIIIGLIRVVGSRVGAVHGNRSIFASRVIAAIGTIDAIGRVVVYSIPAHTCLFATSKEATNDLRFSTIPTKVAVVGVEVRGGAVEKTVGVDLGESSVGSPLVWQHDVSINHLTEGVVHTTIKRQFITALIPTLYSLISTLHIDAGAEGGATVGRGAYAALDIE